MTITIQEHGIYERRDGKIVACAGKLRPEEHLWWVDGLAYTADGRCIEGDDFVRVTREIVVGPGWLPHNGGENPAPGKVVQVICRNGAEFSGPSTGMEWGLPGNHYQILAYRIIEEAETAKEDNTKDPTMTPLEMIKLCQVAQEHSDAQSYAGRKNNYDVEPKLVHDGLLTVYGAITDKGRIWLERALATPLPVRKWVFEEDEE